MNGRYRTHSGHWFALALNGSVANDRGCVKTVLHVVLAQD
jgi:hypothetical protein